MMVGIRKTMREAIGEKDLVCPDCGGRYLF